MRSQDFIDRADTFRKKIYGLKEASPQYPKLYVVEASNEMFVSTLVEFVYNGVRFNRHHVESASNSKDYSKERWEEIKQMAIDRLHESVKECLTKAVPCMFDDVLGII